VAAIASNSDKARELDEGTRAAWAAYSDSLRDLTGEEYEQAERESWSQLQTELRRLERRRRALAQTAG